MKTIHASIVCCLVALSTLTLDTLSPAATIRGSAPLDSELQQITSLVDGDNAAQAEPRLKTYLDAHPDSLAARMLYAKLLYGQQRYWSCIDQSRKVVETDPNNAEAWHNLGNSYQQIHKPDKALESYKRFVALSQDPQPQYQTLINLLQEQTRNPEPLQLRVTGDGTYLRDVTEQGLFRWGHTSPITVFINPGTPVKEYRPEFDEALRQAFDDWAEATNHRFTFVLQQVKDKPDIEISWTDDMHAADWTAEAGDTHLQSGPEGLTSATIRLLTVDPFKQAPLGKEALHAVCLHEIGHALGLQGHSGREGDIMFPILHEDSISARDRDTLIALYDPNLKVSAQLPNTDGYGRPLPNTQLAQRLITDGSNAAVAGDWKHAKEMLEQALALEAASKDESMKMARSNLAVCCNNLAIQDGLPQEDAMKLLYEALYWKSDYEQAQKNMVSMFPERPHPKTAGEHAKAGDDRMKLGDLYGAIVEYRLALAGKDDPAIRTKLTLCVAKLTPKK